MTHFDCFEGVDLLTSFSFGIQAYWGGLAASVVLSSIFPSFHTMANTLPESAQITTQQLIGFVIYIFMFTPIMFVHPSRLQPVLAVVSRTTRRKASLASKTYANLDCENSL
jgi:cytosine/uracil/thiamine/allantoin permease